MKRADRTARVGGYCIFIMAGLLIVTIVAEIIFNISHIVSIPFAIYTIANAFFWTSVINQKNKKNIILFKYLTGFIIGELIYIIPYLIILFVESII